MRKILAALLCVILIAGLVPVSFAKADEPAGTVTGEIGRSITKTKNVKKITLKGDLNEAILKNDITVKKLNVQVKYAKVYAGRGVTVEDLRCNKKNTLILVEALEGSDITINLRKKTVLVLSGSNSAKIKVNALCKDCKVIGNIPSEIVSEYPVKTSSHALYDIAGNDKLHDINWWIENYSDDNVLMSREDIDRMNVANFSNGCGLVDLSKFTEDITAEKVFGMINDYSFPSKEYNGDRKITEEEKEEILRNRNIPENTDDVKLDIRYAVTTQNASIRAFPTDIFLTNELGKYDYMQETGINYYEHLVVLWDSLDGEWSFVQAYDYNGWMKKSEFGYITKDEFDGLLDGVGKGEVKVFGKTGKYVMDINSAGTEFSISLISPEAYAYLDGEAYKDSLISTFRMGTYIPFKDDAYTWVFRDEKGNAVFKTMKRQNNSMSSGEYVEYLGSVNKLTTKNLLTIAGRALGTPYSWGDSSEDGMDCSSTLQGLFKCFGIFIPRNSSQQIKLDADITNISELSKDKKIEFIYDLPLGSILYMHGHVMMYLGEYDGMPYIIHNTTDSARDDKGTTYFNSFVLTTLDLGISGNTLFDRITYAVKLLSK